MDFQEALHPRDEGGRFAAKEGAKAISTRSERRQAITLRRLKTAQARALCRKALEQQGFTYDAINDVFPTTGFAVSIHPEHEEIVKGEVAAERLQQYADDHAEALATPGACFGAWYDVDADRWYFDVTHVEPDRERAIELAHQHGQEGIYDLEKGETIIVKDPGKRRL